MESQLSQHPNITRLSLPTPTLPPATETNAWFLSHEDAFFVVDPATPHAKHQRTLFEAVRERATRGETFEGIVLTHHHNDHVGAAEALRLEFGVPIHAHEATQSRLKKRVHVDHTLHEGDLLLGGFLRVLHTPGHAPGHVCLHCPRQGWIAVGDMLASIGTILIDPDDDGDMDVYLRELARLRDLNASMLLPAHGDEILDAEERLSFYIRHREQREQKIYDALFTANEPLSLIEIVQRAYADTPAWLWPIAAKSARAHLTRLERMNHLRAETEGRWRVAVG